MYIERSRKILTVIYTEFLVIFSNFRKNENFRFSNRREILIEIGNMSGNFGMKFIC